MYGLEFGVKRQICGHPYFEHKVYGVNEFVLSIKKRYLSSGFRPLSV